MHLLYEYKAFPSSEGDLIISQKNNGIKGCNKKAWAKG